MVWVRRILPRPIVYAFSFGETEGKRDQVFALYCNVDDMTAEEIGFAIDRLFAAGALKSLQYPRA